jgi:hypothetical protein
MFRAYELKPLGVAKAPQQTTGRVHPIMLALQKAAYETAIMENLEKQGLLQTPELKDVALKKGQFFCDLYERVYGQPPVRDEYFEDVCRLAKAYETRVNGDSGIELHSQAILPKSIAP